MVLKTEVNFNFSGTEGNKLMFFTFYFQYLIEKTMFSIQIFEIEFLIILHVLRSSDPEMTFLAFFLFHFEAKF